MILYRKTPSAGSGLKIAMQLLGDTAGAAVDMGANAIGKKLAKNNKPDDDKTVGDAANAQEIMSGPSVTTPTPVQGAGSGMYGVEQEQLQEDFSFDDGGKLTPEGGVANKLAEVASAPGLIPILAAESLSSIADIAALGKNRQDAVNESTNYLKDEYLGGLGERPASQTLENYTFGLTSKPTFRLLDKLKQYVNQGSEPARVPNLDEGLPSTGSILEIFSRRSGGKLSPKK
jgi:hypothetical protein